MIGRLREIVWWALGVVNWIFVYLVLPPTMVATGIAFYFLVFDRTPPFERKAGEIVPTEYRGMFVSNEPDENGLTRPRPIVVPSFDPKKPATIRVKYETTKRDPNRVCPGVVSQELIDSCGRRITIEERAAVPAKWSKHPTDPEREIFEGQEVAVPDPPAICYGKVRFKSTSFRWCNFMQERYRSWRVVSEGPDLEFELVAPGQEKK